MCEEVGEGGRLCRNHYKAQWDGILLLWRRVLVGDSVKHPGQMLVKVLHSETMGFYGIAEAFQKVGLDDSMPRRCNQVCLKSVGSGGLVTVTNPVAVHLEDLYRGRFG